jgi:long-chain acyl-CoA synthetase
VSVPLFDTLGAESVEYIVNHADLSMVVTTVDKIDKLISVAPKCPTLKFIICMNLVDKNPAAPTNKALEQWKKTALEKGIEILSFEQVESLGRSFKAPKVSTNRQSLFTICYTSGTTGDPKGVMLTHDNIISASGSMDAIGFTIGPQDSHISYLPLAHCYERVCIWTNLYSGVRCAFFRGDGECKTISHY